MESATRLFASVFFVELLLLVAIDMPRNDFDIFFRIFAELFDYFGALPVSMTLAMYGLPMLLTPAGNFSLGSQLHR
jgi:hypothetical protein